MPVMIDYAFLCQAIDDWRAGRRPQIPPSATPTMPGSGVTSTAPLELYPVAAPEEIEMAPDADSDLIDVEDPIEAEADAEPDAEAGIEAEAEAEAEAASLEGEYAEGEAPIAPPDYDSTMVYGANGEAAWQPADGEPTDR